MIFLFLLFVVVVRAPDPNEPAFNTGKSEDSTESTAIPNNLARWREESRALDGSTSFLCVAGVRSPLLNTLVKQYKEQQALKKSAEEAKKSKNGEKSKTQDIPAPNPSDETTPSMVTPRNESSSADQLRAVADILSQIGSTASSGSGGSTDVVMVTTSSLETTTESTTSESVRMEEGSSTSVGGVAVGGASNEISSQESSRTRTGESMPDLSTFDGTAESARSIISRLNPSDPLYTFLSAVAGAPTPPLPEATPDHTPLTPVPSTPPSNQVSVIQNPRPADQSRSQSQLRSHSTPFRSRDISTLVTDVLMNQNYPGSNSSQSRSQEVVNQISNIVANEIDQAISDHLAAFTTVSSSAHSTSTHSTSPSSVPVPPFVLPPPTSSPSPSDTLAPLFSSLHMPNQSLNHQPSPVNQSDQENSGSHSSHLTAMPSISTNQSDPSSSSSYITATSVSAVSQSLNTTSSESTIASSTSTVSSQSSLASGTSVITSSQSGLATATSTASTESQIPEGIDPTFLAALPDSIRLEVVAQYEREQRQQNQATGSTTNTSRSASATGGGEINPEVLAALPPEIQEEVCDGLIRYMQC